MFLGTLKRFGILKLIYQVSVHKPVKRIQAITNKNSDFSLSRSSTNKNNVFSQSNSPYKNDDFTRLNSRDLLPIHKTYCLFKAGSHLPSACLTLHSQHPGSTNYMWIMHYWSLTNGGFLCHTLQSLWVRWLSMSIVTKCFIWKLGFSYYTHLLSHLFK